MTSTLQKKKGKRNDISLDNLTDIFLFYYTCVLFMSRYLYMLLHIYVVKVTTTQTHIGYLDAIMNLFVDFEYNSRKPEQSKPCLGSVRTQWLHYLILMYHLFSLYCGIACGFEPFMEMLPVY